MSWAPGMIAARQAPIATPPTAAMTTKRRRKTASLSTKKGPGEDPPRMAQGTRGASVRGGRRFAVAVTGRRYAPFMLRLQVCPHGEPARAALWEAIDAVK